MMAADQQTRIEAFAFRKLVEHLQMRTDVQNIDVMNLSGFCRNCLSKWLVAGARAEGLALDYAAACERVYGMPVKEWKSRHQKPATEEQMALFESTSKLHAKHPKPIADGGAAAPLAPAAAMVQSMTHRPVSGAATGAMHSDVCGQECQDSVPAHAAAGGGASAAGASVSAPLPPLAPAAPQLAVELNVGVLTVSDRASAGTYPDVSGPTVQACLAAHAQRHPGTWRLRFVCSAIVPDEQDQIEATLRQWTDLSGTGSAVRAHCNLVLTTGGTGFSSRDVTPEATLAVVQRRAPGLVLAVLARSMAVQPLAMLSRGTAGVRCHDDGTGCALIINLPGRPAAVRENVEILAPALGPAVAQLTGQGL